MKKIYNSLFDETYYTHKLDNGLELIIFHKPDYSLTCACFGTPYGGLNINQKLNDKEYHFDAGVAHFLEHKLFESEDNEKVFDKFKKYGANVNAYTNHFVTNYYFSTNDNFYECLNELVNFVQSPYFTDENVEKEKGIINQEINMTNDDVERFMFEEVFNLALVKNPNKYRTIGDKKNVSKITKEDLYKCYNTFYHPSNMILVIYGDVDVEKTISIVRENQKLKTFNKKEKIEVK